ncbi:hypothetical protein LTR35_012952 [Friedmanniomyces endolithicus]|uniref:Uncharacterized protein n=1 Tax=Friedmanniomyces endolithicus TaxID=329885 RepID=A0AAN6J6M0_9PEZI|nr:hypothetical protein LTR35_012952 [Friedmanniomyces endolithicus]KAK0285511.1 hypothetical protein LTS00_010872 [Friedmanniomyces endolithicus]KAK0319183.1 hypothetical protein LTR82_009947 [Friedmanniomyces endolithicus]KAK0977838.1 hypothetical protein LTR54_016076 [Friedmanniomyces endolithicus]
MCFVGYVHFACGHKRIDSRDCDYALAVQSPFFIRYQCPHYTQARASPDFACGTGKFYCKETKDGPFLEHLHQTVAVARDDMTRIEAQLAKMMEASHMFTEEWNRRGVPSVARPQLQSFQYISTQHRRLMVERGNTRQTHDQSLAVIEQARAYFTRVNHSFRMGEAPAYPPFVPSSNLFGKIPAEIAMAHNAHIAARDNGQVHAPQRPASTPHATLLPPSPAVSNVPIPQRRSAYHSHHPAGALSRQTSHLSQPSSHPLSSAQPRVKEQLHLTIDMQPPPSIKRKRGRPFKNVVSRTRRPQLRDSTHDDDNDVRRSVRVRNKRVNYADSATSHEASREPSPEKSNVSGSSPIKSDGTASPVRGSRDRGMTSWSQPSAGKPPKQASSLGDRINDWARQSKLAEATTPMQRRVMPGMKDLLNSSPANGTPMSTMTSSSPVQAVGIGHRTSMPGSSYPKDMKYSMSDPTGLDAVQQHHTRTGLSLTPSLVRPEIISARAPRHPSFRGLPTSAHTSTTTLPGATDWLVYGQHVHDLSHPHMIPASFSTAPAFNPILQHGASGSGPGSFAAPGTQPFGFRKDSVTGHFEHSASHSLPQMLPPNYGNLRRSFSASTLLTPPVVPSNDTETSEPRKRKQTMRATDETSKRMRLSFPGEQTATGTTRNTEWLLSQGLERTPVPPNTYHGPVGSDVKAELTTSHHGGGPLASPAPRLAPTAVMSAPELTDVSYEGTERQPIDQDEEQSNQYGVEFSDNIDWGTPFEESDAGLM